MQKSSRAWNTDTTMSRKLNWIIKKIILYICVAGLSSKTPTGRENCSLISMILLNFPRNVNYCYCCYQKRQQRRLAIMTSKRSKWNNLLGNLSIIIHWEISVNHCWKCDKNREFWHIWYALVVMVVRYAIVKIYVIERNDVIKRNSNVITIWHTSAIEVTAILKKNLRSEIKGVQEKESIMAVRGR